MKRLLPLLLLTFLLAGCTGGFFQGNNQNQYIDSTRAQYYQGPDGVEMSFDQFPPRLFYYSNAPGSSANEFPFSIQVWNKGASYSRGAVFVSGYDPNLIRIDEIPIGTGLQSACTLRLGDYSLNKLSAVLQCGDKGYARFDEGKGLQALSVYGKRWFSSSILSQINLAVNNQNGGYQVNLGFGNYTSYGEWEHGLKLIALLSGLSFQDFLGQEYLLAGDTYDYPNGEIAFKQFTGHIENWPEGADQVPQTFLATDCFMYTTFAAPVVCIDPDPYSTNRKVCTPLAATWSGGQGAPVAITSITQESTPRTAVFNIQVRNIGGGTVYDPGSLEKCSPYYSGGAKPNDLDTLWIGEARIGDRELNCNSGQMVRLHDGQGSFTCTYSLQNDQMNSAYQTPLVIELWYGYSKTITKSIIVKRVT